MKAGIPYHPFPTIEAGPITLQTFGLCVAVGILLGGWLFVRRSRHLGIPSDQSERVVIALVVAGLIGARIAWVVTSLDQIDSPLDVIAVWEGGLQFSGGFVAAILLAPLLTRRMSGTERWHLLDSAALGLSVGLAIGRIGCYAVGEHLGGTTSFPLGITFRGGQTVEGPLEVGQTYWSLPVIEFLYVALLFALLAWIDRKGTRGAGTLAGLFCVVYAILRFSSDFLREYDRTLYGFTGAQYMMIAMFAAGVVFLRLARNRETPAEYRTRVLGGAGGAAAVAPAAGGEAPDAAGPGDNEESHDEPRDESPDESPGESGDDPPSRPRDGSPTSAVTNAES